MDSLKYFILSEVETFILVAYKTKLYNDSDV